MMLRPLALPIVAALAVAAQPAAAIDPGDPASARRAPPIPDPVQGTGRVSAPPIEPPEIDMPEHVPPADPPQPWQKPWPPDQRTLQRLDEPPFGLRQKPGEPGPCPRGLAQCR